MAKAPADGLPPKSHKVEPSPRSVFAHVVTQSKRQPGGSKKTHQRHLVGRCFLFPHDRGAGFVRPAHRQYVRPAFHVRRVGHDFNFSLRYDRKPGGAVVQLFRGDCFFDFSGRRRDHSLGKPLVHPSASPGNVIRVHDVDRVRTPPRRSRGDGVHGRRGVAELGVRVRRVPSAVRLAVHFNNGKTVRENETRTRVRGGVSLGRVRAS
mmetsp:Transcript_6608/g.24914  ORF Transcript_6608/g.24914 Transcript_6608/m.24914 type:complete len:207 (+) Transcript_6608:294-914(+)